MQIIGLTGSIAMGKSTVAGMLRRLRIPVFDSDAAVHQMFQAGGPGVAVVSALFPEVIVAGAVDRARLGALVLGPDPASQARRTALEAGIHPLVRQAQSRFLRLQARRGMPLVVLDIPLLFETGAENRCNRVLVVCAPRFLQTQRALRRPGMSLAKLQAIRAAQTPDAVKRRKADIVLPSGIGMGFTFRRLRRALAFLRSAPPTNRIPNRIVSRLGQPRFRTPLHARA